VCVALQRLLQEVISVILPALCASLEPEVNGGLLDSGEHRRICVDRVSGAHSSKGALTVQPR